MNGWMTHNFTSFSTVFQSYQDDNERPCTTEHWMGGCFEPGDARSEGLPLTHMGNRNEN